MIESLEVYASGLSVMGGFVMFENEMAEFGNSIPIVIGCNNRCIMRNMMFFKGIQRTIKAGG